MSFNSYDETEAGSIGCMVLVLMAIGIFVGGVAVGHWCW